MPILGAALAVIFYEFVFVKSQEYLDGGSDTESDKASDEGLYSEGARKASTDEDDI